MTGGCQMVHERSSLSILRPPNDLLQALEAPCQRLRQALVGHGAQVVWMQPQCWQLLRWLVWKLLRGMLLGVMSHVQRVCISNREKNLRPQRTNGTN